MDVWMNVTEWNGVGGLNGWMTGGCEVSILCRQDDLGIPSRADVAFDSGGRSVQRLELRFQSQWLGGLRHFGCLRSLQGS